ncbi:MULTISPECIES: LysE family transporter [Mesorhizobium]|uniref:LysE family transporter n=1 Tax=Mesorhizobium TaxID=68287 RepID=UPI0004022949|nr:MULTISPECIES: LysE family transporter [Mesorhizobium]WJI40703.1 LysE family transporter [Mesorhizobium opportunistum]
MTPTAFLAYCAAVTLAAATPGPAMFAVITNGVSRGFLRAFIAGVGVAAGDAVLVTLALLDWWRSPRPSNGSFSC